MQKNLIYYILNPVYNYYGVTLMKKTLFICLVLSCFAFTANARVDFLPSLGGSSHKNPTPTMSSEEWCKSQGYVFKVCGAGQKALEECPKKKKFYKYCCPKDYLFSKEECLERGLSYSSDKCGPYYKCE